MKREIRIGVFGVWRGTAYIKALKLIEGTRVTALCDRMPSRIDEAKKYCDKDVAVFDSFDEFIGSGLFDGVFLCNYFSEHAIYAAECLRRGIHVFSETTAATTMGDCVRLCRAAEASDALYMLAENYPFTLGGFEMKRLFEGGTLGDIRFSEGEYVHPMSPEESNKYYNPAVHGEYHWRRYLPCTFYSTHALAPIMYITGGLPEYVVGMAVRDSEKNIELHQHRHTDAVGVMLLQMNDGSVCRINGSSYMAPKGNWYRVSCSDGGVETVRGDEKKVRLTYNNWSVPDGCEASQIYQPEWQRDGDKADKCGHGGGDYFVVLHFIEAMRGERKPFFDVYRSTAMSATAMLGWRSVLEGSKRYEIPDFRFEADKKAWENDFLTPLPTPDKPNTLPYNSRGF